jgi:predicted negative regulator of RcsB-dependent stress response
MQKPLLGKFPGVLLILLSIAQTSGFEGYGQKSVIQEESRSILTYPFSDPNPVPAMAINSKVSPFYPYFEFDGYTDKGIQQEWKVVSLDNDFINVTILPEVGGKVWGAIEKSTGMEFVYQNHVMKFRAIGIRGPWTSGGIEHNFGLDLGHAPWTASPVDYLLKENPDGSVSCIVGGLDLASRTQWRVNILLPKDKAYFETRSMWYNPTPLHDSYLSWENAGFRASDDLQFFFPGNYYIGHDGAVNPWPVDSEGRDLSWYKNNNFGSSKSYHVSGYFTDWFGGYWHDSDFGFGHSAPYSDVPGKKIWIWSLAREGAIWKDLLTDKDGQYIEAQSGVKFNQANPESGYNSPYNQLSMRPHYTETKNEYWFPVVRTCGLTDASEYGSLNVIPSKDSLDIYFCPNTEINDSIVINLDGKYFRSSIIRLKPLQVYHETISLKGIEYMNVGVKIGHDLLSYSSDNKELFTGRPSRSALKDYNSAEHLFKLAEDMNAMRDYSQALQYYLKCLEKEPTHSRALYRVAELYYKQARYDEGLEVAKKILENDTYDASANFISGMIYSRLGKLNQAEEAFSVAARTMEFRSAGYLQIAGLKIRANDLRGSIQYSSKALDFNRYNIPAYELLATCYRKLGNPVESDHILNELLEIDPLCHYARFERYLLNPSTENLNSFKSLIRNELPYETYIELAMEYVNMDLSNEAIQVLEQSPSYPVVYYWLAYLYRNSSPEKSNLYLSKADDMSPHLVFPHRLETIPVLNWAVNKNQSWKSKYYLGLIYWHILQNDKAAELFEKCGDIPDYAPFYIARGTLFRNIQTEYCHPCNDFNTAVRIDPAEWRTWHYLITFLQSNGAFQEELKNSEKAYGRFPENPVIGTDYAKSLLNSGKYSECIKVLEKVKILPQEGAQEGHDIFDLANLSLAEEMTEKGKFREALKYLDRSKDWPENLGAGKPYEPDTRFHDYIAAYCYEKLGDPGSAESCYEKIMCNSLKEWGRDQEPFNIFIANQIFIDHGKKDIAGQAMEKWKAEQDSLYIWNITPGSSSPRARWLMAKYIGDDKIAAELENEIVSVPAENRFRLCLRTYNNINRKGNESTIRSK